MKTSINFKAVKSDSEIHNFRKKTFDYIRKDLTPKNEYWISERILDRQQKIENYCKEKSGRKLQKNAIPIREAVVVIKENTTMQELHHLAKRLQEELHIRVFQIAIHKDEGHLDKDSKEWKPNYHAHLVADWQDLNTGKTLKHQSFHYSKMQDLAAECLNMERGISGSKERLEAIEFKIHKKEEEYKALEEKMLRLRNEIGAKTSKDLIVKENDLLGFQRIKTDKTINNYEKVLKNYGFLLEKNKQELESKKKQISELQESVSVLKKEISKLNNKSNIILCDKSRYDAEKEKYQKSVIDTLERAILYERYKSSSRDRSDPEKLKEEMADICQTVSEQNRIPHQVFTEIFSDNKKSSHLFFLLKMGKNYKDMLSKVQKNSELGIGDERIQAEERIRGKLKR